MSASSTETKTPPTTAPATSASDLKVSYEDFLPGNMNMPNNAKAVITLDVPEPGTGVYRHYPFFYNYGSTVAPLSLELCEIESETGLMKSDPAAIKKKKKGAESAKVEVNPNRKLGEYISAVLTPIPHRDPAVAQRNVDRMKKCIAVLEQIYRVCVDGFYEVRAQADKPYFDKTNPRAAEWKPIAQYPEDDFGKPMPGRPPRVYFKPYLRTIGDIDVGTSFTYAVKNAMTDVIELRPWTNPKETLKGARIRFIPVISLPRVYSGAGGMSVQHTLTTAIITGYSPIQNVTMQVSTARLLSEQDPEMLSNIAKALREVEIERASEIERANKERKEKKEKKADVAPAVAAAAAPTPTPTPSVMPTYPQPQPSYPNGYPPQPSYYGGAPAHPAHAAYPSAGYPQAGGSITPATGYPPAPASAASGYPPAGTMTPAGYNGMPAGSVTPGGFPGGMAYHAPS